MSYRTSEESASEDDSRSNSKSFTKCPFGGQGDDVSAMDSVIQVMNQLYDVGNRLNLQGHDNINLPQVTVCGSQSSGKTSVLESISGEEFLPRGIDIQTRCPIVLQLNNVKGKGKWVEFLHLPGKKFTDMADVKNEINTISKKIDETGQVVSEEPITLKLYSPNVPNLTLVDLPGLVENPVQDQPTDVVQKINDLVYKYISNKNCIILAISSATTDIADSKSIAMSKKVDPQGRRTLGVLTKLDLMDEGTNAMDVLAGKKIKLELGIIGVVNRSFKEVQDGKSFEDQVQKERQFLQFNYPTLAACNGTGYLINRVSKLLMQTIQGTLPDIKRLVEELVDKYQDELEEIGEPTEFVDKGKDAILLELLTKFVESYTAQVDGRRRNLELNSLNASAKIKQVFDLFLGKEFDKLVASKKLTDTEIDNAILNSHALHSRRIDYDDAFQELAKREIKNLYPFVLKCAREVNKEMKNAIDTSCDVQIKMHSKLYQKIKNVALELISERFKDCNKYLDDYLNAEASIARTIRGGFRDKSGTDAPESTNNSGDDGYQYVNDQQDPKVISSDSPKKGLEKQNSLADQFNDQSISFEDRELHRANVRKDIHMYFQRAKMQIMEHVARGIVFKLVYGTSNLMTRYMLQKLHNAPNAEQLLSEENVDVLEQQRKDTQELLNTCEKANEVIDMILDKVNNF